MIATLRNRALVALMLGHFTNDMLGGMLTLFLPVAKSQYGLSNGEVGLIALSYAAASSLSQPIFGWFTDRRLRRWVPAAVLTWGGTFASLYGVASSYQMLLVFASLAGLASGAYHPIGASSAAAVVDSRSRNQALSIYTVGGTSGFALGPLVGVALLSAFGPRGTIVLLPVALVVAVLLFHEMGNVLGRVRTTPSARLGPDTADAVPYRVLAKVIGTVMLRSWVFLSLLQFIPIRYDDLGYSRSMYGSLVTTVILAGAAGTLIGGSLADRIGGRFVLVTSLALSVPPLLLFIAFPGPWAFLAGAVFGLIADSSLSVTLVAAQRLLPGRTGVASGIILGLGFVTGGIGVPVTGRLADSIGIAPALTTLALVALAASALALTIPSWVFAAESVADSSLQPGGTAPASAGHLRPSSDTVGS